MANVVEHPEPTIIQGGMGVAVSGWELARAVSLTGQLGVVSGVGLDAVFVRRLQLGDVGGHLRRALAEFPYPRMADRLLDRYFIPGGKSPAAAFAPTVSVTLEPTRAQLELLVVANFAEVFLAREGHHGPIGINFLEKIQTPTLPSLFGAMLAGVDYVLMGAGIPRAIPGVLDKLANGEPVELPLNVIDARPEDHFAVHFDPHDFTGGDLPWLERPKFLAIVASATLASLLARKASGRVDGFIVEGPTAGGHNAPPREKAKFNDCGEPVYGDRDIVDLNEIAALDRPFWLAGMYGSPEQLDSALKAGATGVQVGTAFAFCRESGLRSDIKQQVYKMCRDGNAQVYTDPLASPTGFPFKVLQLADSLSDDAVYEKRRRVCDMGHLRQCYRNPDGTVGWRCPGERLDAYLQKGGDIDDTVGRKCICNGLIANVGLGQIRRGSLQEPPLVTCGNDVRSIITFLNASKGNDYTAADVVKHLLSGVPALVTG